MSAGCDNAVKVWGFNEAAKEWKVEQVLEGHSDWVRDAAWAPNVGLPMNTIASCGQDGQVFLLCPQTLPALISFPPAFIRPPVIFRRSFCALKPAGPEFTPSGPLFTPSRLHSPLRYIQVLLLCPSTILPLNSTSVALHPPLLAFIHPPVNSGVRVDAKRGGQPVEKAAHHGLQGARVARVVVRHWKHSRGV